MGTYVFDVEVQMGDARHPRFARRATNLLCIAFKKVGKGNKIRLAHTKEQIDKALDILLEEGNTLIAHNAPFDAEAIYHLTGRPVRVKLLDTLSLSKTVRKDLGMMDYMDEFDNGYNRVPDDMCGSHSLAAWTIRLGDKRKDSEEMFGTSFDWANAQYSDKMGEYCKQDIDILEDLYNHLIDLAEVNPNHTDATGRSRTISSTMHYWSLRRADEGGYLNDDNIDPEDGEKYGYPYNKDDFE